MVTGTVTRIYRIVHLDNLPLLLEQGGIWCGNEIALRGLDYKTIGNKDLTQSRSSSPVPCGSGGNLNDYVPFYFSPRSVMLYLIDKRHSSTYGGGQEPILHLVTTVEAIAKAELSYAFTDPHAYVHTRQIYDDLTHLDKLDWNTIRSKEWHNIESDPDRKERKMAEFLVYRFVPWTLIQGIGVFSQSYKEDVTIILERFGANTPVQIKQSWYY